MLESETTFERPWSRQRLRVPREDEMLFAEPLLAEAAQLVLENRTCFQCRDSNLQGRSLQELREWSREKIVQAARHYTSELIQDTIAEEPFDYIVAGGHQPTLFHPGVWVKNFAIGELASRTGGVALNIVIDNDVLTTPRVRVPGGTRAHPTIQTIPFDEDQTSGPWEEARILNPAIFESFGERLRAHMAQWNIEPLVADIWPDAVNQMAHSTHLRDCLTAARHQLERRWGTANLELPISRLCKTDPFLWFCSYLLAQLPKFRAIHNDVLADYRRVNKIRSRTHPVPELKADDGWLEAPFWVWREGERRRGHVFAKQLAREIQLSDGTDVFATLPLTPDVDATQAVDVLRNLPSQGIRLRTRALSTTLFVRLCLADLFIHGIGGAKYDEITDHLIARFFKLPAPGFLTMSATLHLPLAAPFDVRKNDETRLRGLLRDLRFNSDRHLTVGTNENTDALIAEKSKLITQQHATRTSGLSRRERRHASRENRNRWQRFHETDRELAAHTANQQRRTLEELATVQCQLNANLVLEDREFAFCLYPQEKLHPFMTTLWER